MEMRFFGGLSVDETAEVLKVSPVDRRSRLEILPRMAAAKGDAGAAPASPTNRHNLFIDWRVDKWQK